MDEKGQAYSVFKLLIAAIVAVAILYILLNILGPIKPPGNTIQEAARQEINAKAISINEMGSIKRAAFKAGTNITPSALVGNSGLTPDQICIHKGNHASNTNFRISGNNLVNQGSDQEVGASVMCAKSGELVNQLNLVLTGLQVDFSGDAGFCNCPIDEPESAQVCCAVVLKYAS